MAETAKCIKLIVDNTDISFAGTNSTTSHFSINKSIGSPLNIHRKITFWVNGRK